MKLKQLHYVSKDWSVGNMKTNWIKLIVLTMILVLFNDVVAVDDILAIHKHLINKNGII